MMQFERINAINPDLVSLYCNGVALWQIPACCDFGDEEGKLARRSAEQCEDLRRDIRFTTATAPPNKRPRKTSI